MKWTEDAPHSSLWKLVYLTLISLSPKSQLPKGHYYQPTGWHRKRATAGRATTTTSATTTRNRIHHRNNSHQSHMIKNYVKEMNQELCNGESIWRGDKGKLNWVRNACQQLRRCILMLTQVITGHQIQAKCSPLAHRETESQSQPLCHLPMV